MTNHKTSRLLCLTLYALSGACTQDTAKETSRDRHGEKDQHVHESDNDERPKEGAERHSKVVRISPDAIARMGIRIAKADSVSAAGALEIPAEVQAEPDREAHISSVVSGQVAAVQVSVGDRVEKGQHLASIRSVALGEARAQSARSRATMEVAKANFQRQEELQQEGIGSKRQYLEAQATLRRAEAEKSAADRALEVYGRGGRGSEIKIKSPIAGRVVARHATVGEVVAPGDTLFNVTDIARVWAVGRVYQKNAGQVREGDPVILTLQALPGRTFSGQLAYVAPTLDERTRTLPVHVVLDNPDGSLRPGLFGTLSISPKSDEAQRHPVVVPSAIQRLGDQSVVFIPGEEEGEYQAVDISVRSRGRNLTTIEGLKPGDPYVADGAFALKSELSRDELGDGD